MTNEDILSQFPEGELKNTLRELIAAIDTLSQKHPTYGFHFRLYIPGWIGLIQECMAESKMQKFNKNVFYASRGYANFVNWIAEKADVVANEYNETENIAEEDASARKKLIIAIFESLIEAWAKCCPEIATYCNIKFDDKINISPMGWIQYRLASTLQKFDYPRINSKPSKRSFMSEMKIQGYYIIGYILNAIILVCVWGIIIAIFK